MNLQQALEQIAKDFDLAAPQLRSFAIEDPHDGWDHDEGSWPTGSIWTVEGQVLYALVRHARPTKVLEIGTWAGCSATHIAQALVDNKKGKLTCIDASVSAGEGIPDNLRNVITFKAENAYENLAAQTAVDFIFEDGVHGAKDVEKVVRMAIEKLTPGGWLISHDAAHFLAGAEIMQGYRSAGIEPRVYLIEPSDCGLAVWRKSGEPEPEKAVTPKPKTARKRKPRAATPKAEKVPAVGDFKSYG